MAKAARSRRQIVRNILIIAALTAFAAAPGTAQRPADSLRSAADKIEEAAPMIDRATGAMLDLDVGPLLDAADPYGPRGHHRTLREIAGRGDPRFEQRLRGSIYETSAGMARMMDAFAAAEPALRRSMRDMEAAIEGAVVEARSAPRRLPPGEVDDDWDLDLDDEGPDDEPY
jgi:hypothetical protein